MRAAIFSLILILYWSAGFSNVEVIVFASPEHEERYTALITELRCLVCQNQTISSSNADLAKDLRQQVYNRIKAGQSDEQIIEYMVARYGDFVLYSPPFKATTALLWIGPFVLLVVGLLIMVMFIRSRSRQAPPDVDQQNLDRARRLLDKSNKLP